MRGRRCHPCLMGRANVFLEAAPRQAVCTGSVWRRTKRNLVGPGAGFRRASRNVKRQRSSFGDKATAARATAARSGAICENSIVVNVSGDDKFGSTILTAGAALLQRLLLFPSRAFLGLTSELKAIYWAAMDVVVIITSVKTMWHSIPGDLTRCFRNPCGESGMERLGLLWFVVITRRCLGGTLWYSSAEQ